MKKKIIGITGCRSEYDIIYPVIKAMEKNSAFDASLVVCGGHLSRRFGYTVSEIEKDGFKIVSRIRNLVDDDGEIGKAKSAGNLMVKLSETLGRLKPDYAMVVGDREEAVVAGVTCTYLGIPLIHIAGGDRTTPRAGDVDEPIRHATSKMAAIHFTMNEKHKERLLKMGEEPWRVCNTGSPALDRFKEIKYIEKDEILKYFGFKDKKKPLVLVIQHVISGEAHEGASQIDATLKAVSSIECNSVVNYPNTDTGSRRMIRVIEKYRKLPNIRITKNIPRKEFVSLLRAIDLLVGNSSLAFLEGSFLRIPAVNVGERNLNRMNGGNVIFASHDAARIKETIKKVLFDEKMSNKLKKCQSVYGDGNAAQKIIEYIKGLNKSKQELLAKNISY